MLDLFCGPGMMGLAAQACSDNDFVRQLSPTSEKDKVGQRLAFLVDLAPAATHIAANYNTACNTDAFERECNLILDQFRDECGWMYSTLDPALRTRASGLLCMVRRFRLSGLWT